MKFTLNKKIAKFKNLNDKLKDSEKVQKIKSLEAINLEKELKFQTCMAEEKIKADRIVLIRLEEKHKYTQEQLKLNLKKEKTIF